MKPFNVMSSAYVYINSCMISDPGGGGGPGIFSLLGVGGGGGGEAPKCHALNWAI